MTTRFHRNPDFDTLQVHAGQDVHGDHSNGARAVPVFATTSFCFDPEQSPTLFGPQSTEHVYSRISNPTVSVVEQRVAALEGGVSGMATSSGMAAQFVALLSLARAGDNIVSSAFLYGGTRNQLQETFKGFGIDVRFVSSDNPAEFEAMIDNKTRAIYVESIGNPTLIVNPIKELAQLAHSRGMPLVVDNTLGMGGFLLRPIDHGADIIVESASKWICGHGTTIAGVVVDAGTFDWKAAGDKYIGFNTPSRALQGRTYADVFGRNAFAAKARGEMIRDMGPSLDPFSAFLLLQGLETLSLRSERHCVNALQLAKFLESHPTLTSVSYPGLESHPSHERSKLYMRPGLFGGVLTFRLKGGDTSANVFIKNLKLASHLVNLGDTKTLVICPGLTTHSQSSDEIRREAGITGDLIRVSVGIEAIDDIIADFQYALSQVESQILLCSTV